MRISGRRTYPAVATSTLLILLVGCSTPPPAPISLPVADRSPFTGNPCSAPCWQGLVVGKSTETEVRSRLSTLTDIDQKTIRDVPRSAMPGLTPDLIAAGVEIHANSVHPPRASLALSLPQNVLARIEILLFYPISAGDAVADLGPPDYIGYQQMGAEERTCKIVFMWSTKQLVLDSAAEALGNSRPQSNCDTLRDTGKIPSDVMIQKVSYMTVPWMEELRNDDGSEYYKFAGFVPGK